MTKENVNELEKHIEDVNITAAQTIVFDESGLNGLSLVTGLLRVKMKLDGCTDWVQAQYGATLSNGFW